MADTERFQEVGERADATDPSVYEAPTLTMLGSLDGLTTNGLISAQDLVLPID
jgi:hypothetical protein